MLKGSRLTDAFVAVLATAGGLVYIWAFLPHPWAVVASVALLYECYTLVNDQPNDSISETIWRASDAYPLFPAIGFASFVMAVSEGWIKDPHVIIPLAMLAGHFWFPRYGARKAGS